jgi:hypothetical protein
MVTLDWRDRYFDCLLSQLSGLILIATTATSTDRRKVPDDLLELRIVHFL